MTKKRLKDGTQVDVVIEGSYIVRIFFLSSCILHERLNRETMDGCEFVWRSPRVSLK
jgi:hypothetical protein